MTDAGPKGKQREQVSSCHPVVFQQPNSPCVRPVSNEGCVGQAKQSTWPLQLPEQRKLLLCNKPELLWSFLSQKDSTETSIIPTSKLDH